MQKIKLDVFLLLALLCFALPTAAQDRSLSWNALTVQAKLDEQGALHITERHAMVFDGEWNGGERSFQLRSFHKLALQRLAEVDAQTGVPMPWHEGDLSNVGEYRLDDNVLRWRNRLPSDPPFENATRIYELAYVLEGVLIPEGDQYRLEHNLAFPDRSGVIRVFDATLELDPVWDAPGLQTQWHEENLQPGESVFANASLRFVGVERPTAVARVAALPSANSAPTLRYALLGVIILFVIVHVVTLLRRERRAGRFEPPTPLGQIDEQWLQANLFDLPPEVVGAAWDFDTSASEVAALLARLTQEGALKTEVRSSGSGWFKKDVMYMELVRDREQLAEHERKLIDGLFFGGSRMTDSEKIRRHYSKSGFTPATLIKSGIEAQLPMIFANRLAVPRWAKLLTLVLFIAAVVTLIISVSQSDDAAAAVIFSSIALLVCYVFSIVFAYKYRNNVYDLRGRFMRTLIALNAMYAVVAFVMLSNKVVVVPLALFTLSLFALCFINSVFNMMRIREREDSLQLRRKLASARHFFESELESEQPKLKDEWFPYLLAFGLGPNVDKWFKIAPPSARSMGRTATGSGGSGSTSAGASPSWTGGGGTFGGAGATGAWSAAVGGIAAGVSQPSSSSGGRSSGGGSSRSSGGGGGGGW